MPKLIDYPRTSYTGAWELAEIVDDTGGKCAIETAAKKLNRKVSGSFKAIIGSAVKFGLMTSKRELLTNTTLFRRIKHAYDKAEELQFHREAFLTPPLFTQLCRKFRGRELPVQMLDVMLIREFGVEEINAQNVAKAFVDGCRMCGLIDERNIIADIDAINNRIPRRELASATPPLNTYTETRASDEGADTVNRKTATTDSKDISELLGLFGQANNKEAEPAVIGNEQPLDAPDAIASLFGLIESNPITNDKEVGSTVKAQVSTGPQERFIQSAPSRVPFESETAATAETVKTSIAAPSGFGIYQMQMSGPGVNTSLDITEEEDITIAIALLEKIRRQLRANI